MSSTVSRSSAQRVEQCRAMSSTSILSPFSSVGQFFNFFFNLVCFEENTPNSAPLPVSMARTVFAWLRFFRFVRFVRSSVSSLSFLSFSLPPFLPPLFGRPQVSRVVSFVCVFSVVSLPSLPPLLGRPQVSRVVSFVCVFCKELIKLFGIDQTTLLVSTSPKDKVKKLYNSRLALLDGSWLKCPWPRP